MRRNLFLYLSLLTSIGFVGLGSSYHVATSPAWRYAYGIVTLEEKIDEQTTESDLTADPAQVAVVDGTTRVVYEEMGFELEFLRLVIICIIFWFCVTLAFPIAGHKVWDQQIIPRRLPSQLWNRWTTDLSNPLDRSSDYTCRLSSHRWTLPASNRVRVRRGYVSSRKSVSSLLGTVHRVLALQYGYLPRHRRTNHANGLCLDSS